MTTSTIHIEAGAFATFDYRTLLNGHHSSPRLGRGAGYTDGTYAIWFQADTPEDFIRLGKALIVEGHNWNEELLAASGNRNTDL